MPYHPAASRATTGPVPTIHRPQGPLCNPKEVLERAIQARGGEALLKKLQTASYTGAGKSVPQNHVETFKFRTLSALPDRSRDESDYPGGVKFVQVFNRDKGWVSINTDVKVMDPVNLRNQKQQLYQNLLLTLIPLREARFTLEPLPETRMEGVIVQGFVIKCKDQQDMSLFVEKENGLPLMAKTRVVDPNTLVEREQETYFTNYAAMHGLQFPKRWAIYSDGNKSHELNFEEFKLLDKVDDILFAKP